MSEADFTLVFDGGSLGNPGRGYGSYRLKPRGADWLPAVRLEFGSSVTNNEAEYRALLAALEAVKALCGNPAHTSVEVRGDSQLVINHLNGTWKVRAANLKPLFQRARSTLQSFKSARLVWHPRTESVDLLGH